MLAEARALILDPANWCQEAFARDERGRSVEACHGVRFCALGALHRVYTPATNTEYCLELRALGIAAKKLYDSSMIQVNDNRGHAAVIAVYDEAINGLRD